MDWSLVLGVLGILVSIVVGWLTYRLADRRARNNRRLHAKTTVLQELSKSLGENSVPTPDILEATIRSVLREVGDPKVELDVDEVLDDLVRQVTSDPFLDSERRRKLQSDIQRVRTEASAKKLVTHRNELEMFDESSVPSLWSILGAVIAGLGTLITFMLAITEKDKPFRPEVVKWLSNQEWLVGGIAIVALAVLLLLNGPDFMQKLREIFNRSDKD